MSLDEKWQQRFNKPLHHDDGKRESYPLIPTGDREARPLSRKAKESLRQEGNDEVPGSVLGSVAARLRASSGS